MERELDDELRHFVEMETQERLRAGASRDEALRLARLHVGGITATRERVLAAGWEAHVERAWKDVRYGLRGLLRHPGFASVALLTLALGIGANTAMFSVVNAVMLRPLPYREADRLVLLFTADARRGLLREETAHSTIADFRAQSRTFQDIAFFSARRVATVSGGERRTARRAHVSGNLFSVLGAVPLLGRGITTTDEAERAPVVVISYLLWQQHFSGARDAVGRILRLDDPSKGGIAAFTVVGVMPPEFYFPDKTTSMWVPASTYARFDREGIERFASWARRWTAVGRLADGATLDEAREELARLATRLESLHRSSDPDFPGFHATVVPALDYVADSRTQRALWLLLGAAAFVLLVACANVANLLLARGATREGELAVRRALGAGRGRLVRQLITENLVLVAAGGLLGGLLGIWATQALRVAAGPFVPRLDEPGVDWRVLLFAAAISALSAFVFGLMPALRLSSASASEALRTAGRGTGSVRLRRQRGALVVIECALAVCLVAGAGLLLRSLLRLQAVDPGFDPSGVLAVRLEFPADGSSDVSSQAARAQARVHQLQELMARIGAVPTVEEVGFIDDMFVAGAANETIAIPGRSGTVTTAGELLESAVSPGFFEALRVPLRRGRYPHTGDAVVKVRALWTPSPTGASLAERAGLALAEPVAVNEAFVHRYFVGEDPLGKRFCVDPANKTYCYEIAGVIGDMRRQGLEKNAVAQYFVAYLPAPQGRVDMVVRATDAAHIEAAVRREVTAAFPGVTIVNMASLDAQLGQFGAQRRFQAGLLSTFAALAVALAAIGIFGVVQYAVSERTREFGIRAALGATSADVLRMVVAEGMRLPLLGIAIGIAAASAVTRVMRTMLFGVGAIDAATFVGAVVLLVCIASVACLSAARRAVRVKPIEALR